MLAGSAAFSTPIGYQTNLMVLGPGGYSFGDFVKFGMPLQIIIMMVTVPLCVWFFGREWFASSSSRVVAHPFPFKAIFLLRNYMFTLRFPLS
eukprot:13657_4